MNHTTWPPQPLPGQTGSGWHHFSLLLAELPGGFPKPPSAPGGQHAAWPGRRSCQPQSKTRTSAGTGSLKHLVLSIELLASLGGVVSLPDPTLHSLATCPLGPWPDPQLHAGVTRAPHELPWLPDAVTQGTANPAPGWPSDKDHSTEPLFTPRGTTLAGWAPGAQSSGQLSVPPWTPYPVPCLTPVSHSWYQESHRKINHRALNLCLRLCFWGETQAKRPSDSSCPGRSNSPEEAACSGGPTQELRVGRDVTPPGPPPARLAPKVLGSLKSPALGHVARRLPHVPSAWHPKLPKLSFHSSSPLLSPSFPPCVSTDTPMTTVTVWGSDVLPQIHMLKSSTAQDLSTRLHLETGLLKRS